MSLKQIYKKMIEATDKKKSGINGPVTNAGGINIIKIKQILFALILLILK